MQQIQITHLQLKQIEVSRTNPRKTFDETDLQELSASITEKGVLQPILVRPFKKDKFEIIAGERRYRASKLAGLETIPAIIREMSDEEALEVQIIENLQRKDVHPMEEAVGFMHLITIKKMDVREVSARVGKAPQYVAQRLKFNDLIEPIQKIFYDGRLKVKDALQLAAMSKDTQEALYEDDLKDESGQIELNGWRMKKYRHQLNNAPFDLSDATIDPAAGACTSCQFNSGYGNLLFPEEAENPICRNGRCFERKCELNYNIQLAAAIADPTMVLISGWYDSGHEKEGKDLKKRGIDVLNSREYEKIRKPECDDREFFDGDNDTEEEDEADYQKALAEYRDEMRQYEAEIASGKYTRALKIDESDKGSIYYVKITRKGAAKSDGSGKSAPVSSEEADIRNEIERLRDREKRAKELDSSKIYEALKPHFNPRANSSVFKGKLETFEIRAAALAIYEKIDWSHRDEFRKQFKIDGRKMDLSHVTEEMFYQMVRFFYLHVVPPPYAQQGGYGDRLNMSYVIAEHMFPSVTADIKAKQIEVATKRADRVDTKIKALQKKLAELKKAEKPAAGKKGKGVKALLPDA